VAFSDREHGGSAGARESAELYLAQSHAKRLRGEFRRPVKIRFRDFAEEWLRVYAKPNVPANPDALAEPVDIAPTEGEELAASHPSREGREDGDSALAVQLLQQPPDLVGAEEVHFPSEERAGA
jgi:hypothetical protein